MQPVQYCNTDQHRNPSSEPSRDSIRLTQSITVRKQIVINMWSSAKDTFGLYFITLMIWIFCKWKHQLYPIKVYLHLHLSIYLHRLQIYKTFSWAADMALARNGRITKELATLKRSPPPGAQCWQVLDDLNIFSQIWTLCKSEGGRQDGHAGGGVAGAARHSVQRRRVQARDLAARALPLRAAQAEVRHTDLPPQCGRGRQNLLGYSQGTVRI